MLDAGSSHTSLYIYKWPAEKENDTGVVSQVEECKLKGKMKKKGGESLRGMWQVKHMRKREANENIVVLLLLLSYYYYYKNSIEISNDQALKK